MLSAAEFGKQLCASGDLDPVYLMLQRANLDRGTIERWCLAYWCFYHAGVASRIAEAPVKRFWELMEKADVEKWPRGSERRHFRGHQSARALQELAARYPDPRKGVRWVATGHPNLISRPQQFSEVAARARNWRGFGTWISFKIADMVDAVLGVPVDFSSAALSLWDEPLIGAFIVFQQHAGEFLSVAGAKYEFFQASPAERKEVLERALDVLGVQMKGVAVPHAPDHTLRLQELETVLCKYKAHLNGHYPVGKDTREVSHALVGWGDLAAQLAATFNHNGNGE